MKISMHQQLTGGLSFFMSLDIIEGYFFQRDLDSYQDGLQAEYREKKLPSLSHYRASKFVDAFPFPILRYFS